MELSGSNRQKPMRAKSALKTAPARGKSARRDVDQVRPLTIISSTDIARRAYELFLLRGGEHGQDVHDWLHAEGELRGAQD